jgi:hypothetical protein
VNTYPPSTRIKAVIRTWGMLLLYATGTGLARADDSLARLAPADVGMFVEVHRVEDVLAALTEPQLWTTLADLAGQPARPEQTDIWRRQIRSTVQMEPVEAIRVLFKGGVAFLGQGLGRSRDGVVICRPAEGVEPRELVREWGGRRLADPRFPGAYHVRGRIAVAIRDGALVFGDLQNESGLFGHVLATLASGAPRLADDPLFRRLLAAAPENPDGVLFARLDSDRPEMAAAGPAATAPTSQPVHPGLPGPLATSPNILLTLHRVGPRLHFTFVGDRPAVTTEGARGPREGPNLIRTLPSSTLAAWQSRVDYERLVRHIDALPEQNALHVALRLQRPLGTVERLVQTLKGPTCLAIGHVETAGNTPPFPAAALLIRVSDERSADSEFNALIESCITVLDFMSLARGMPTMPRVRETPIGPARAYVLELDAVLAGTPLAELKALQLCWTVHDGLLIVATHQHWLQEILQARRDSDPALGPVLALPRRPLPPDSENVIVLRSGLIAEIAAKWLAHFQSSAPEVLEEDWWRDRQPGGRAVRLGIDVRQDRENRRLLVRAVREDAPADGYLQAGDAIVGCNRRRFESDTPIREIREGIAGRPDVHRVLLLVERDDRLRVVAIPVSFVNPIETLQRIVYYDDQPQEDFSRAFLTVELRTSGQTLLKERESVLGARSP